MEEATCSCRAKCVCVSSLKSTRKGCTFKVSFCCPPTLLYNFQVLECITLSEETTTSSSRIFVKIFFQELSEYMGLPNLNARLKDE